jgi:hypothetical protein
MATNSDTQGHDYAPKIRFPALRDCANAGIRLILCKQSGRAERVVKNNFFVVL